MPAALIIGIGPVRPKKGGGPLFGSQSKSSKGSKSDRSVGNGIGEEGATTAPPDFSSLMGSHAEDRGSRPSVPPMGSANQKSSAAQVTSEPRPSFSEDETANPSSTIADEGDKGAADEEKSEGGQYLIAPLNLDTLGLRSGDQVCGTCEYYDGAGLRCRLGQSATHSTIEPDYSCGAHTPEGQGGPNEEAQEVAHGMEPATLATV